MPNFLTDLDDALHFDHSQLAFKVNRIVLFKLSKTSPFLSAIWQYLLVLCNYQDTEYWSASTNGPSKSSSQIITPVGEKTEANNDSTNSGTDSSLIALNESAQLEGNDSLEHEMPETLSSRVNSKLTYSIKNSDNFPSQLSQKCQNSHLIISSCHNLHPTINEQLFKYFSLTVFSELIANRNPLDHTTGLTMLLINSLSELFDLASHESTVLDLFSTIHRNSAASSLFIHSITSNWHSLLAHRKLHLLHACLKSLEGVHLSASGHLLTLIVDKYFQLPYLSLVRYADHIACQRVEMMLSFTGEELLTQLSEELLLNLRKFFAEFKYSFRHQRLISLLEQLNGNLQVEDPEPNTPGKFQIDSNRFI